MPTIAFALYNAFSDSLFGGSQAGIVSDSAGLDAATKRRIVREMGLPAIGFVLAANGNSIAAQFQSTVMELPMCGHGTIGLMTRLVELGVLDWQGGERIDVTLALAAGTAAVSITKRDDGRPLVMLAVEPPDFREDKIDRARLARLLGLGKESFSDLWPIETAVGDFIHLVVPIENLAAMRKVEPDFDGLVKFCQDSGIETVALFTTEVEQEASTIHVRDFCPAVGVAESPAAGTTNAALAGYLVRHGMVKANGDGRIEVVAEQGHEINRPSQVRSVATLDNSKIIKLQVGGVATKVSESLLQI